MANIITGFRALINIVLLFCLVLSPAFYMLYLIAGFSDMIDGIIARRTNTVSEFGAGFDTAADFVFVVVCLIKFLPVISMPTWLCVWIVMIALIKIVNIISGYIVQRRLVAVHSVMNKVTGVLLFILPLTFSIVPLKYSTIPVCAIATFAAVQEGHFIRTDPDRK
jgi:CDP-diacylglycerol--glycerol-3-phosphate 3-phosphatidyltransferase